jgi:hypothetical protein
MWHNEMQCRSKYTWYNFAPLFLFEQFTRFANAYFLLVRDVFCGMLISCNVACSSRMQVSILQTIPNISITNGIPTNFLPLSIVLTFDGIVTAREDYKRHLDDARANASKSKQVHMLVLIHVIRVAIFSVRCSPHTPKWTVS